MGNPYEPLSNASDYTKNEEPETTSEVNTEEIPEGNISELKDWVGDDKDRAQLVLDDENSQDNPRKTLVKHLEEVING